MPPQQHTEIQTLHQLIRTELAPAIRGQLRLSRPDRMLYATDASIYQVEPLGVAIPATIDEIPTIAAFCFKHAIPLLPRGGGTSLPGQCANRALVVDYSPTCRRLLDLDPLARTCRVEPGIAIDDLNRQIASSGLFFAPDPATAAQCCIGGCIGNNAAGARSIRYGRTSENLAALEVSLADGQITKLGPGAGRSDGLALFLAQRVADVVTEYASQIRQRYPKTTRRNAGYALDLILNQLDAGIPAHDLDLTGLLCGSEGSLALTLRATLKLHPIPRSKGLAIVSFMSLQDAISAVPACLSTGCSAVELIDDIVLKAASGNSECRQYMDLLPTISGRPPAAVLYVEYQHDGTMEIVQHSFDQLRATLGHPAIACYTDTTALLRAWALRKAGEPLLHGLPGHRKPVTCVEDNAVPVENLFRFIEGFKQIVNKHGTRAAYYAHASVGVLHVRPMLDLHDPADRDRLRRIAQEISQWAKECGGVMSGEHGDGRIRGPLLPDFYGPALMTAFATIKAIFDPKRILNPGMIVDPGDIPSITQHLRVLPDQRPLTFPPVDTYFHYTDQEGFGGALEMCNGAGVCRKTAGGTMCPSYRALLDERHSTRGRGNALRLAISGQINSADGAPAWNDPDTLQTLRFCLSCKACKNECPSNVDLARLNAEYLAQSYRHAGRKPLAARVFGRVRLLNRLGSLAPRLTNFVLSRPFVRSAMQAILKIDARRSLPQYQKSLHRQLAKDHRTWPMTEKAPSLLTLSAHHSDVTPGQMPLPCQWAQAAPENPPARPRIVLFADCFTTYNEPRVGLAAVSVLRQLGYEVIVPKTACCGRSMISTGLLDEAIASADRVLSQLRPYIQDPTIQAIVVAEPSCLSAFKDDYLQLRCTTPISLRQQLAAKAMLLEQFIESRWDQHPIPPTLPPGDRLPPVLLHAHCHQKALWGAESSAKLLRRLCGSQLRVLDTGCCGMAGSFGFTTDRYDLSMQIAELSLLPLVRNAPSNALLVAPGTSCRHQIHDGAARHAMHPIELVQWILTGATPLPPDGSPPPPNDIS